MRTELRPWIWGAVFAAAGIGWFVKPAPRDRLPAAAAAAAATAPAGEAPGDVEGEVVAVEPHAVVIDGRRLAIAPVLAAQLHAGDRIHAELSGAGPQITRVHFLHRAAPPRDPADHTLAIGDELPAMSVPGTGGPIALGAGQGTPTVLAFLFTSCGVPTACPLLSQKLERLQAAIRGHGRIVAITLDPDTDTLPRLRAYAGTHHADPATWQLGRLELAELTPLLARLAIVRVEQGGLLVHGLDVLVLDGRGRLAWRSEGNTWTVEALAERLRTISSPAT